MFWVNRNHFAIQGKAGAIFHGRSQLIIVLDLMTVKYMLDYFASPMKLFGRFGLACFAIALAAGLGSTIMKVTSGADMTGNPLTLLSVLGTIAAIQFFSLGLLGEVAARIYYGQSRRHNYAVRDFVNCGDSQRPPLRRAA